MHGGTEWPNIASTNNGIVIIPANNIPWIARLNDPYIKQFVNLVLKELNIQASWRGKGINAKCFTKNGKCIVACDKEYYRPLEVDTLLGSSKKAKEELNWEAKIKIEELVKDMVSSELKRLNSE